MDGLKRRLHWLGVLYTNEDTAPSQKNLQSIFDGEAQPIQPVEDITTELGAITTLAEMAKKGAKKPPGSKAGSKAGSKSKSNSVSAAQAKGASMKGATGKSQKRTRAASKTKTYDDSDDSESESVQEPSHKKRKSKPSSPPSEKEDESEKEVESEKELESSEAEPEEDSDDDGYGKGKGSGSESEDDDDDEEEEPVTLEGVMDEYERSGQVLCNTPVRKAVMERFNSITPDDDCSDLIRFNEGLMDYAAKASEMEKEMEKKLGVLVAANYELKKVNAQLKTDNDVLKITKKKKKKGKEYTREQKKMLDDVNHAMLKYYVRMVKFPQRGWDLWSMHEDSCCQIVCSRIDWPPDISMDNKKAMWNDFIKGSLPRMVTQIKNRITQDMRKTFFGKWFCFDCCYLYATHDNLHVLLLLVCNPTDNAIDGDELEKEMVNLPHKTVVGASDFLKLMDDANKQHVVESFVKFIHLYARHSAPKDESKKFLDDMHCRRKRHLDAHEGEADGSADEIDSDVYNHPCLLDFLSASDLAYTLWQYFNSHKDWKRKHEAKGTADEESVRYETKTKYTSDKRGNGVTEEGVLVYELLLKFSRDLKSQPKCGMVERRQLYNRLRILCNKKALQIGVMSAPKEEETAQEMEDQSLPALTEQRIHTEDFLPNLAELANSTAV